MSHRHRISSSHIIFFLVSLLTTAANAVIFTYLVVLTKVDLRQGGGWWRLEVKTSLETRDVEAKMKDEEKKRFCVWICRNMERRGVGRWREKRRRTTTPTAGSNFFYFTRHMTRGFDHVHSSRTSLGFVLLMRMTTPFTLSCSFVKVGSCLIGSSRGND